MSDSEKHILIECHNATIERRKVEGGWDVVITIPFMNGGEQLMAKIVKAHELVCKSKEG